jgi:mRNA interferase MazF
MTTPNQPSKTGPKRGDVVLVPFPNSDLRRAKLRPALIVQANDLATGLSQIVLVMISSNLSRSGHRSRFLIETNSEKGKQSGLLFDSVVMCDNIATVSISVVHRTIGQFGEMVEVNKALRHTLGL